MNKIDQHAWPELSTCTCILIITYCYPSHSLYGNPIGDVGREALATAANLTGVYM